MIPSWLRMAGTSPERGTLFPVWLRDLIADRTLWAVLLIWVSCWLSWAVYLERFANSLPWCDEYKAFVHTGIATGKQPITFEFLWAPANEHRAPLTRLESVLLGRVFNWNSRYMLQANLTIMALGCLPLILAVRAVRGRSSLCDAFLPLLILTSAHQQTLAVYVYAYAMALGVWCVTAGAVLLKWHLRSIPHLLLYILGALIVTWAGGPAGNLWALGLCVPLVLGCFERDGVGWKGCALVGSTAIAASSALMIYCVPSPSQCLVYRSESLNMTCRAAAKFAVGWMGQPILQVIWPWSLLVLLIPLCYLLVRFLVDIYRIRKAVLSRWLDLTALLTSAFLVTVVMGYGRARYPGIWDSRYCALEVPIAVVLFLMLVRCAAPKSLMNSMAIAMAICVGWNWPSAIDSGRAMRAGQLQLTNELRAGHEPLSLLAERYSITTGWGKPGGLQHLLGWWQEMRLARISVFGQRADLAQRCSFWHSETGSLNDSLHRIDDPNAVAGHAVEALSGGAPPTAVYEVTVPTNQVYKLCCRWRTPAPGRTFAVSVDDGPAMAQYVPDGPEYIPCVLVPMLPLAAGAHRLAVTWPGPGSRLDVLELNPQ